MTLKFSSYAFMWFLANASYFHVFFIRYPRQEIRVGVPAIGVLANIPMVLLMMSHTRWSLGKARSFGFYYTILMFFVFLLVGLFLAARIPTRYICDDSPSFCARHTTRETFLAFINGLQMFLVYGGVIFLEILRAQIISAQLHDIIKREMSEEDQNSFDENNWI